MVAKKVPPTLEQLAGMSAERRWYWTHLEEARVRAKVRQKEHWQVLKRQVFDKLGGAVCIRCGCDDLSILEINHIDGDKSKDADHPENWSRTASIYQDIVAGRRPIEGLSVLCRVCNNAEWAERKGGKERGHHEIRWVPA